ncbi:MAG TPA: hypothetical protein ENI27_06920 [bacterium]|nr:hypothetical protein [bacterium]
MAEIPEKSKLEEMSSDLPEKERKEFLAKLTRSPPGGERDEIVQIELKQEERERLIGEEMLQQDAWTRFLLWLKRFFSGKTKRELFLNMKLGQIKKRIKQLNPGISGFETRNLTPRFARQVFDLYAALFPLKDLFAAFTHDQEFQKKSFHYLFNERYENSKHDLEEFIPLKELEDIYAGGGYENEVRKQVLRKFNEYLRKIPEKLYTQLEEGLKPFVYLQVLFSFSFTGIFRHFNYFLGDRLDEKYPYFDHGPAMLMLDQLERLYHAVYLPLKMGEDWFCHEEILHTFCLHRRQADEADEIDTHEIEQEIIELSADLAGLVEANNRFCRKVLVLDLIRYFRKDPYYRLLFNIPRFNIKTMYTTALKSRVLEQLDERMIDIKKNVVDRKIKDTFKTEQLLDLFYYTEKPNFDFRKLGLPYFTYTKSLMVLYNYLSKIYKGYIQDVVQIANAYVLSNNRLVQSRLIQYAAGLEELEAKIVLHDRSLSPDEDDGKTLMRYRHRIASDLNQQKMYRSFIIQKDTEANTLLERGEECLIGIKKIFDELVISPMESVKSLLKTLHIHRGKNQTLIHLLKSTSEIIGDFHDLLDQLLVLEKGS